MNNVFFFFSASVASKYVPFAFFYVKYLERKNLTIPYGIEPIRILTSSAFVSFFSFLFPHFIDDGRER